MKKIFSITLSATMLLAIASTATSCLEKYPDSAIPADKAINTLDELDQAAIGVYDAFKSSALYSGYLTLLPDIQCDMVHAKVGCQGIDHHKHFVHHYFIFGSVTCKQRYDRHTIKSSKRMI